MNAKSLAQCTGAVSATCTVEHRDPETGQLVTDSVDTYDRLAEYGVRFEGEQGPYVQTDDFMTLAELVARGGRIVRVRWIGGEYVPGRGRCYDLSYVHGEIGNARVSITHLPAAFLVPRRELKGEMIAWAKEEGVYAKGCGLLDSGNYSILG
jgi:hypothetical protein